MNIPEQVLHDRVNLIRLTRRLENSVNEHNWDSEPSTALWLKSEGLLQQLKHARKLLTNVEFYNEAHPSSWVLSWFSNIRGLLDKLDAFMLSVNERVAPEPPRFVPFLSTLPFSPPSFQKSDLPVVQRLAPPSDITTGTLPEVEPVAEVDLLLGSADDDPISPGSTAGAGAAATSLFPPKFGASASFSTADVAPTQALMQHSTALQEELSAQLAQMAGQLRRNAEHFSNALAADQAVLRNAEEKTGANYDVMKRERVRLRDHRGKSLGTTCLTITSVLVVAIAFLITFFIIRFT
ncbi:hypothetical protein B0F90DRAFT_1655625 [Multifurca ochricompacta]|uniref:Uncharacterized protein n=1 Tax=Multifurca ochricompacta TaxID=376703 RepID=A0AAD4LUN0_9AGAM|nr:hypothetical protein B0F90DRAFT_1655625 [Multifurca ochricompacta]